LKTTENRQVKNGEILTTRIYILEVLPGR